MNGALFRAGLFASFGTLEESKLEKYEPLGSDPDHPDPEESGIRPVLNSGRTLAAAITLIDCLPIAKGYCDRYKIVRSGCFFSDGPHKSGDCLRKAESIA